MMDIVNVLMFVFMTGTFCIMSFLLGAFIAGGRTKKINLNPVEAYKEHKETERIKAENDLQQRQLDAMMYNIENFPYSQKDIPNN